MKTKIYLFLVVMLFTATAFAQSYEVTGVVTDNNKQPVPGATVVIKGTTTGTTTDFDGKYTLSVEKGDVLVFTSVGYEETSKTMDGSTSVNVSMAEGLVLDEVVVTGNRAKPRTALDSPVPIDNISAKELQRSGKIQVEQMLTYKVPSFNSATQAISDATAHFDPADLRGLGPSRTLVLMNGKRMKQSAQIYLNGTPGKGEVGIDLKSFPNAAVKRIEVLRDGASAQYGSDAIAGVINIILKDDTDFSEVNTHAGITSEGDGFNMGIDFNSTFKLGEGTVNLSLEHYNQKITNRAGDLGVGGLPGAPNVGDYIDANDPLYIRDVTYHNNLLEWVKDNPGIGMIVGQPELKKNSALANLTYPLGDNAEFYTFHTFTKRKGKSFAYYRAPQWRPDVQAAEFLSDYVDHVGYHPTFETVVLDNMNVAGIKFDLGGFKTDLSATYGRNYVDYTVNNSVNRDYLADHGTSPRTFHPGGYAFSNFITNLDFSKEFNDMVSTSFGLEYKEEYYKGHKGDERSYYGGGSDSFAGIKPAEAMDVSRNNFAAYVGLDFDITEAFLIGGAARYEDFSDFGSNFSWKVNGRFKIGDNVALRASASTGFRAPTLHQRYIQLTQYIIVSPNPDPQLQGTLPNNSDAVKGLGVPNLHAETSQNFSFGGTAKFGKLNITADIYQISVDDRVLFSSQIKPLDGALDGSDPVEQILIDNDVLALQFFINAVNTKTTGTDIVIDYSNVPVGEGSFGASLAMNFNNTKLEGKVANPSILETGGYDIFNHREELRITDSRPKSKILLGLNYAVSGFNVALNNTRFGEVTVAGETAVDDQVHSSKIVTDFIMGYDFSDSVSLSFTANNLFDVYPDILNDGTNGTVDLRSAGGRFDYSSEVTQMGQLGTNFMLSLKMKF
ncbi:MAG TPA: signal protein [Flavobacteriaceae bacterium]|jgi:iron complex outermembrane receptor protein|nr:signal protein [Flavobacteriaceae bacterium]HBS13165.1 signal protein [Flavobacteriaceae bacterium]